MSRARLVPRPLVPVIALAFLMGLPTAGAATVSSRVLVEAGGENDGDSFGCSVAAAGDVNGDGYDDVIIGANYYPGLGGRGRAYLYFGGPAIDSVADLVIPSPAAGNIGWFGISVASAGDFNGDGYADAIVGARYSGLPGKAFIYYGGPSPDATPDRTLSGEVTGSSSYFGSSVASAGDVNGDGFDDVIVGAPVYGSGGSQSGRAYIYFGGAAPDTIPDLVVTGLAAGDQLGSVVGSAGDMNGDGHPDAFASAPSNDAGGTNAGAVYVWFGGPGMDAIADVTILGSGANQHLTNVAGAGDVNADGFSDLIVSESDHVGIYFGGPAPDAVPDVTLASSFVSVAGAGDVNGDGIDDVVLGDSGDDTGGTDAGRVSVFYGGTTVDTVEDLHFIGDRPGRMLGLCVAGAGHVGGPGPADLIAGATDDPEQVGYNRGRAYVYANSPEPTAIPAESDFGLMFVGPRPNPAWNEVGLVLALDHPVPVRITVFDLAGHVVARPVRDEWLMGRVTRTWRPRGLPGGVYYVSARLGEREQVRRLVWLGNR